MALYNIGRIFLYLILVVFSVEVFSQHLNERKIFLEDNQTQIDLWEEINQFGKRKAFYKITQGAVTHSRLADYELKLRHGGFDPLIEAPTPKAKKLTKKPNQNMYIVQFYTQPLEAFVQAIKKEGGVVYFFLANHAYIVKMPPRTREEIATLPFVRWVGAFHPAYRLEEFMLDNENQGIQTPSQKYNIMLIESDKRIKASVAARIRELGGQVHREHAGKYLMEATLSHEQLMEISTWDEILFVDRWSGIEVDMNNARQISGVNFLESVQGLTGEGVRGEVLDRGFNLDHVDFQHHPFIEHNQVEFRSHGTKCAGIIFGDGTGNPDGRGMLPMGQGIVANASGLMVGQPRYDHTAELVAAPYFAVFQSSSYGSLSHSSEYSTITAEMDAILFDFDLVHIQSQGNLGNQRSRPQAWAKNIISAGGIRHQNTLDRSDDCWCLGASIGPAIDGRIKPDLSAYYDSIFTTTSDSNIAYTGTFSGTSASAAIISGQVGLVFEMWHRGLLGNKPDPNASVFENRCHMATAKALLINSAYRYDFNSEESPDLLRVRQGWGMPDLEALYNLRDRLLVIDETEILPNMGKATYSVDVLAGEPEFKATLVFTDPPGLPLSSQHRINDFNLKVTSPSGTVYWGNNGLIEGNFSKPGGMPNQIDTVENVFIQNPEAGAWSVEVIAHEINQDSHVETVELDGDFALVVTGGIQGPGFGLSPNPSSLDACAPATAATQIDILSLLGFNENVTLMASDLPAGAIGTFSQTTIVPPSVATFTLSNLAAVQPGKYTVSITGTSSSQTKVVLVTFNIGNALPPAPELLSPINGTTQVGLKPTLAWEDNAQSSRYTVEVADDPYFSNTVYVVTTTNTEHDLELELELGVCYYWRLRGNNACGDGQWRYSAFTTLDQHDYLTEEFYPGKKFDLEQKTLAFIPDGTGNDYRSCLSPAVGFPTDPSGGTPFGLSLYDSFTITPSIPVVFLGETYPRIFVGSNGFVTFISPDFRDNTDLFAFFSDIRIGFLYSSLYPDIGGSFSYKETPDRLAITFQDVPSLIGGEKNSVQIEFFHNNEIHITWLDIGEEMAIVGISKGILPFQGFDQNDFSMSSDCSDPPDPPVIGCTASECIEDINNDGQIDATDLWLCIVNWNNTSGPVDLNQDGRIDVLDLVGLFNAFGACTTK